MAGYVKKEGGMSVIGFMDSPENRDFLENIMFLEFKVKKGDKVKKGQSLLSAESLKGTSELLSDVEGVVVERNDNVQDDPDILKKRPKEWLLKISQ